LSTFAGHLVEQEQVIPERAYAIWEEEARPERKDGERRLPAEAGITSSRDNVDAQGRAAGNRTPERRGLPQPKLGRSIVSA
jgi:hypothetical protein